MDRIFGTPKRTDSSRSWRQWCSVIHLSVYPSHAGKTQNGTIIFNSTTNCVNQLIRLSVLKNPQQSRKPKPITFCSVTPRSRRLMKCPSENQCKTATARIWKNSLKFRIGIQCASQWPPPATHCWVPTPMSKTDQRPRVIRIWDRCNRRSTHMTIIWKLPWTNYWAIKLAGTSNRSRPCHFHWIRARQTFSLSSRPKRSHPSNIRQPELVCSLQSSTIAELKITPRWDIIISWQRPRILSILRQKTIWNIIKGLLRRGWKRGPTQ